MSRHRFHNPGDQEKCRDQNQRALEVLDHYHFAHTDNGLTAFVCHECDILVISDLLIRAKLRRVFADGGIQDFPEPPAKHGDEVIEAHVPNIEQGTAKQQRRWQ